MEEKFAIPCVSAVIYKKENEKILIATQIRDKPGIGIEKGLLEIPAGKIREYESVFDTLKREIDEETGLKLEVIYGQNDSIRDNTMGYDTFNFHPFNITQNLAKGYSIIVFSFLCEASGTMLKETNESKEIGWTSIEEIENLLLTKRESLYPMHIITFELLVNKFLK